MPRTRPIPEVVEIWGICPVCLGTGEVKEKYKVIAASASKQHMLKHAYTVDPESRQLIGANCDCPRVTKTVTRKCLRCAPITRHRVLLRVRIPKPGEQVWAKKEIFGKAFPDGPAEVAKILHPEDVTNRYELEHGWAVMVRWEDENETWAFDLGELILPS